MKKLNKKLDNENGSALVIVMMVLVVVSALGGALGMVTINSHNLAEHTQDTNSAYYIAEAGANIAYEEFKTHVLSAYETHGTKGDFDRKVEEAREDIDNTIYGESYFPSNDSDKIEAVIEIIKLEDEESTHVIRSTGIVDGKTRTVEKEVKVTWKGKSNNIPDLFEIPKNASVVAKNKVTYIGGTISNDIYLYSELDSSFVTNDSIYHMPENIYSSYGQVKTNKKLFRGSGGGVERIIDMLNERTTYTPPVEDRSVAYENYFQEMEKLSVGDSGKDIIFQRNQEKQFEGIVRARDLVTLGTNTINVGKNHVFLVVDNIKNKEWTTLEIKGEGSLTIYVKDSVSLNGLYNIDHTKNVPGNLRIIFPHKNKEIQLIGGGTLLGAQIIAPFSHIINTRNPLIYGSILADQITITNNGGEIHYHEMNFGVTSNADDENVNLEDIISSTPATEN